MNVIITERILAEGGTEVNPMIGYLGYLNPSEIGSPWSSLSHSTGRVAFHPVRFCYRTGGINCLGLLS